MCRLFAYLGPPVSLERLLLVPPHSLLHQSWAPRRQRHGTINADGWGVGWYDTARRSEPARYRTSRPMWADRSFASWAGLVDSSAVLAAVRSATPPAPVEESGTPPFTAGHWLFAHNGAVEGFRTEVGTKLRRLVSDRRAAGIEGASDSEVLFALALDHLDQGATAGDALSEVTRTVLELTPARLNLVLTDGRSIAATACGDSLSVLSGAGLAEGGSLVASEPCDDEPGWQVVPDGSLVVATAEGLSVTSLRESAATPDDQRPDDQRPDDQRPDDQRHMTDPRTLSVEVHLGPDDIAVALKRDARHGLLAHPKELPPKWFYDELGSLLFEAITRLPEYYPARREREILRQHAGDVAAFNGADTVVELGSGSSEKTRVLLDALAGAGTLRRFVPFDVSEGILRSSGIAIADAYPGVEVRGVVGDFERHLGALPAGGRRLVVFLGGTIGNLLPEQRKAFLSEVAGAMERGDALLLGTDLVKDPDRLVAAYDDSVGVTAAFNRNLLSVLNRELSADFVPPRYAHVARWNTDEERIEMRLRSLGEQEVALAAIDTSVVFADGEEMRTEVSAKFRRPGVEAELGSVGLEVQRWWTDAAGDYALSLSTR